MIVACVFLTMLFSGPVGVGNACASGPDDLQQRVFGGNEAYERGDYLDAIEIYRGILDTGMESPDLYFNLGNAYLKSGQLGWALVNYERARRLAPRDGDIRANLEYARARRVDVLPEKRAPWVVAILLRAHRLLSLEQSMWVTCILWFALGLVMITRLFGRRFQQALGSAGVAITVILILSITSLGFKIYDVEAREPGIVVTEEVQVMSGPGEDYSREFILHAGTEVNIKRTYQGWLEVSLSEQMRGWVGAATVERI